MTPGRVAHQHKFFGIEVPLRGVAVKPTERTPCCFHGRGRQRMAGHAILDIDDRPTLFEKGQELQNTSLFGTEDPPTPVEVNQCRTRCLYVMLIPDVEFK